MSLCDPKYPSRLPEEIGCRVWIARKGQPEQLVDVPAGKDIFEVVALAAGQLSDPATAAEQQRRDKAFAQIMHARKESKAPGGAEQRTQSPREAARPSGAGDAALFTEEKP